MELVAEGLHAVRLPLPVRVAPVNAYVGRGPDGVTIVDTGLAIDAEANWTHALAACGVRPADVQRIFITHFHPDHIGAAGPLAQLTGATVVASAVTVEQSLGTWGPGMQRSMARIDDFLRSHGVPDDLLAQLAPERAATHLAVQLPDHMQALKLDSMLEFANAQWRLVATPGHADGHVVLVDEANDRMLAGDHVLQRISPAVGRFPDHAVDPLGNFLDSLRLVAEFDNFRKRSERDRSEYAQYAGMETVREILPVLDNFDIAIKTETPDKHYSKGIELIYQRMVDSLKKLGLEPIESVGEKFDPHIHQAIEKVQTEDAADHTILSDFQRGYRFKGKLLRPSMVKVAVHP